MTTTDREKRLIVNHLRLIGAKALLKIGPFQGETTRILASVIAENDGRVVVIDPMTTPSEVVRNGMARQLFRSFPRSMASVERWLGRATFEPPWWGAGRANGRIDFVVHHGAPGDAALVGSSALELRSFDGVLVDGERSYTSVRDSLFHWGRRVRPGGLLMIQGATPAHRGVLEAVEEWRSDGRVHITLPRDGQLCVIAVRGDLGGTLHAAAHAHEPDPYDEAPWTSDREALS